MPQTNNNLKRHIERFVRCLEYHEPVKDERGEITRKAYLSFNLNSITDDQNKLHEYQQVLSDAIHKIETDDESRYSFLGGCLDAITDFDPQTLEDLTEWDYNESIDSDVDVYTGDLTAWLDRSNYNVYYLTEAMQQFDHKDGFALLTAAQHIAIQEVYDSVLNGIIEFLKQKMNKL